MSSSPLLSGEAIRLCPFAKRHLSVKYLGWLNDAQLMRYSEQRHRTHSFETCHAFVSKFENGPDLLWAIESKASGGAHVGTITAAIDLNNGIADIAVMVGVPGHGYGKEAWHLVMRYLERRGDIRKITGGCIAENIAMSRIMQTCGMLPDGCRKHHFIVNNQPVDVVYFAKFTDHAAPTSKPKISRG